MCHGPINSIIVKDEQKWLAVNLRTTNYAIGFSKVYKYPYLNKEATGLRTLIFGANNLVPSS